MRGSKAKKLRKSAGIVWRSLHARAPRSLHGSNGYYLGAKGEIRCRGERAIYQASKKQTRPGLAVVVPQVSDHRSAVSVQPVGRVSDPARTEVAS